MRYPFWCCGIPTDMPQNTFCDWWRIFNAFVPKRAVTFCTTHGQNKTLRFDTEGFVPVSSLWGVVGSPYWFTKCLIGRTGNIWSVLNINEKCIYLLETHAWTIIEYTIVRKFCHVTSTWPFISWRFGAANASCTPHTERPSWNYLEVNCMPDPVWIISISHQPNSSNFASID